MSKKEDLDALPSLDENERKTDPPPGGGDMYSAGTIVREAPDDILQALKKHEALEAKKLDDLKASIKPGPPTVEIKEPTPASGRSPVKPPPPPNKPPRPISKTPSLAPEIEIEAEIEPSPAGESMGVTTMPPPSSSSTPLGVAGHDANGLPILDLSSGNKDVDGNVDGALLVDSEESAYSDSVAPMVPSMPPKSPFGGAGSPENRPAALALLGVGAGGFFLLAIALGAWWPLLIAVPAALGLGLLLKPTLLRR